MARVYPQEAPSVWGWLLATPPSPTWSRPILMAVMSVLEALWRPQQPQLPPQPLQPPPQHPVLDHAQWCQQLSQPLQWIRFKLCFSERLLNFQYLGIQTWLPGQVWLWSLHWHVPALLWGSEVWQTTSWQQSGLEGRLCSGWCCDWGWDIRLNYF